MVGYLELIKSVSNKLNMQYESKSRKIHAAHHSKRNSVTCTMTERAEEKFYL